MSVRAGLALALLLAAPSSPAQDEELRNWFDDPFIRLTRGDADCPQPAGPYATAQERLAQSHRRAEKGTTAWLAGEADRPKAFAYDADIAAGLVQAFRSDARFPGSSIWATVQGRVVYLEGCLAQASDVKALEDLARAVPYVQQVISIVRTERGAPVPYRLMPARK